MSNPFADYSTSLLAALADPDLVDVVSARLEAGTAVWARGEFGPVLLATETDRPLLEIVHTPGEGDDFEASEELLEEALNIRIDELAAETRLAAQGETPEWREL